MKRYGWMVGLAVLVTVLPLCYIYGIAKPESLYPYKAGFRYPNVPEQFSVSRYDKPQHPLRVAKSRSEIVAWADANDIMFVQNVGHFAFLLSNDIGSGGSVWVLYLYVWRGNRWHLLYVGNGGLGLLDNFQCVRYDASKRAVIFSRADGKVLSTLQIGKEMDLLERGH